MAFSLVTFIHYDFTTPIRRKVNGNKTAYNIKIVV